MVWIIVEKELREIVGSTKFSISFAVCSVLILFAFYAGATGYHTERERHQAALQANLKQMEGATDWLTVGNHRIFLPPQPLAFLVAGVSNDIGRTTPIGEGGETVQDDSRYNDEPVYAAFRFLDLEFIIQVVLSLFAILFSYDAISGEKERGTLRLAFAGPLARRTYMGGKLLGSFLALAVPLLIPFLIGAVLLPLMGVPMSADEWVRLGLIAVAGILYVAAFLSIGVAVSAMTGRSSNAFLILLVLWVFAVLIVPRGAVLTAGRAVDVPSVDEIGAQLAGFSQQQAAENRQKISEFRGTGEPSAVIQEFQKFMGEIASDREKKTHELASRLNEERSNRQAVQEKLALGLARVSPAAAFSLAATTLAGTSLRLKERYHEAAREYRMAYNKFMLDKTGVNPGSGLVIRVVTDNGEKPKPIDPLEMPPFVYRRETVGDVLPAGIVDMGVLALVCVVFFAIAHLAFLRYDLR